VNSVSALEAVIKYELSLGKILIKFLVHIREDLTQELFKDSRIKNGIN
jgi:hypothetical protein